MSSIQCCRPDDKNCRQGSQQHHSSSIAQMFGSVFKPQGGHNHNHNGSSSTATCQTQCYPQTHQGQHMNHNQSMGKPANSNGHGYGNGPMNHAHCTSQTNGGQLHARGGSAACQGKTQRRRGLLRRIKDGISGDSSSSDSESDSDNEGRRRNRANRC